MKSKKLDYFKSLSGVCYIEQPTEMFYSEYSSPVLAICAVSLEVNIFKMEEIIKNLFSSYKRVNLRKGFDVSFTDEDEAKEFVKSMNKLIKDKLKEMC